MQPQEYNLIYSQLPKKISFATEQEYAVSITQHWSQYSNIESTWRHRPNLSLPQESLCTFTWSWAALTWDGSWRSAVLHSSDKEKKTQVALRKRNKEPSLRARRKPRGWKEGGRGRAAPWGCRGRREKRSSRGNESRSGRERQGRTSYRVRSMLPLLRSDLHLRTCWSLSPFQTLTWASLLEPPALNCPFSSSPLFSS